MQSFEHAQAQQVELHQPSCGAIILIPLQHRAVFHARPLHGHDIRNRPVAQHHAAGVNPQVARLAQKLLSQGFNIRRRGRHALRPRIGRALRVAQRPGGIPQRALAAIGNHVRHLRRPLAAVLGIDVLDNLLAPPGFNINVNIRRTIAVRGKETLKEQACGNRLRIRNPQRETHRRIRCRPAPLTQDVFPFTKVHQITHDEEVAGKSQLLDHTQLIAHLLPRPAPNLLRARGIANCRALEGEVLQPGHLGMPFRHVEVRQVRGQRLPGKTAFFEDANGFRNQLGALRQQARHLFPGAQPGRAHGVGVGGGVGKREASRQGLFGPGQARAIPRGGSRVGSSDGAWNRQGIQQ